MASHKTSAGLNVCVGETLLISTKNVQEPGFVFFMFSENAFSEQKRLSLRNFSTTYICKISLKRALNPLF